MKSLNVTNVLLAAADFFSTGAGQKPWMSRENIQLLFYRRKDLERKRGETDLSAEEKARKRIEKIHQTLAVLASQPLEEQPDYPDPIVKILNDYQKNSHELVQTMEAGKISQEQFIETQNNFNGQFNNQLSGFIAQSPVPALGGLVTTAGQAVVSKAAGGLISKAVAALGFATGPLGKVATFLIAKFGPEVLSWAKRNLKWVAAGAGALVGFALAGFGGGALGAGAGYIGTSALTGGVAGLQGTVGTLGAGASVLIGGILSATIGALIIPFAILLLVVPVAIAFILFVINSGAYLVPPGAGGIAAVSGLPEGCPGGWPVDISQGQTYYVNQGPGGNSSHGPPDWPYNEAIDIHPGALRNNLFIVATHPGVAKSDVDEYGGLYVSIRDSCKGNFISQYVHLSTALVKTGQVINKGDVLGIMGSTGYSSGVHLHYEFRNVDGSHKTRSSQPPFMIQPYIPKDVPVGCVGRASCNVDVP